MQSDETPFSRRRFVLKLVLIPPFLMLCMFLYDRGVPLKTSDVIRAGTPLAMRRVEIQGKSSILTVYGNSEQGILGVAQRRSDDTDGPAWTLTPPLKGELEALLTRWCTTGMPRTTSVHPAYYEVIFLCPTSTWKRQTLYFQPAELPDALRVLDQEVPSLP
jgi:hypothetical protein